ncbi:serine hydrolase [Actinomadura sp. WMMA1423]|uniref:serine hydrolase domain-containing protein n=1 Tax=Actinomadura sp. WMMA1423 TaxID=2591108 RepID=UPI00143DAC5E|nr:serine hydrolase domain-containing protein [Actinomadura sp. WMMA1423]
MPEASRRVVIGAAVVALFLGVVAAPVRAATGTEAADVDRFVRGRLAGARLPGAALAVTRGDSTVLVRGYGRDGEGDRIGPETRFRVGSLSKSFTAFAVMRRVEAGQIGLDQPVRRYLPGFRLADAEGGRITVRELLNQTSGLGDGGFLRIARDRQTSLAGRVADLRHARLVDSPGRAFHYCDLNYQVLGRVLEVVSGRSLSEELRLSVFEPLGMRDTVSVTAAQDGRRLAHGGIVVFGFPVGRPELPGLVGGSGGVITTARDISRWLTLHAGGTSPLLSAAGMQALHTPPPGVDGGYAMGWFSPPGRPRRLEHNGVLSTFYADQVVLPESRVGVALLYPVNDSLADTNGIKEGLVALMSGRRPAAARFPDGRATAVLLGLLTLGSAVLRTRALVRLRRWTERARARGRWRTLALTAPQIAWPVVPAVLVIALPRLMLLLTGRAFSYTQLFLAMPAAEVWLVTAGILGLALGTARVVALPRRPARAADHR